MSQRTLAAILAVPLLLGLLVVVATQPLPYVTYRPGPTVDILGAPKGEEIVEVEGAETYRDSGELHLTTIYVDQPQDRIRLDQLMRAWIDPERAVYPYDAVYGPDDTDESNDAESFVQMVSSQDAAVATALKELGYDVEPKTEVLYVEEDLPADGVLKVRDILLEVDGKEIDSAQDVVDAVDGATQGQPVEFRIRRQGQVLTKRVTPREVDGDTRIGITPGPGFVFPFEVSVDVGDDIGGPSAGLMFSLAIYDTLTPGSLTGGEVVAGSGTIDAEGRAGPIGGVQQKIAGAAAAGAKLFLVAADNCSDTTGIDTEDLRLVRVETMHDAVEAITTWVDDPDAALPTCEDES
ncbi:YlbL family protein [Nocardioides piscis]|uniref:PDZ domain-containing protein n=1 Tax=Nocardioides piscis TaxID=2714938 RepID=A0A6G7YG71_9ACTN|nr:PDZ domain-containing protein [Nocardioides piscis]QIK75666.1 PDZ domain-containing protein [Nocardioides piscis]